MQDSDLPPPQRLLCYRVHGLTVRSDGVFAPHGVAGCSPLPAAAPGALEERTADGGCSEVVDVSIEVGLVPYAPSEQAIGLWYQQDDLEVLELPGLARFEVQGGRLVRVWPAVGVVLQDLVALLWSAVWPVLLMQRGWVVLRGAAVTREGATALLLGRPGAGKSLAAAWLTRHGFSLLADDLLVLQPLEDAAVAVLPGPPRVRLWPAGLELLGWDPLAGMPARASVVAREVPLQTAALPAPVRWVIDLETAVDVNQGTVCPLEGRAAFGALLAGWREHSRAGSALRAKAMEHLARLARSAAVWSLRRMSGNVADTMRLLLRIVSEDPELALGTPRLVVPRVEASLAAATPSKEGARPPQGAYWLVSYPKSGNTWMRALLASYEADGPVDLNALPGWGKLHSRMSFELWSGVTSALLTVSELADLRPQHACALRHAARGVSYVKVHNACVPAPRGGLQLPAEAALGVVYLVRSPLDVAISFAHHLGVTVEEVIGLMADPQMVLLDQRRDLTPGLPQPLTTWSAHVRSWLGSPHRLLMVRYEDLLENTARELERVICFAGGSPDGERIGRAVERCRFDRLQQAEQRHGFVEKLAPQRFFFREGRAGGGREQLTFAQIARLLGDHGPVMEALGYAEGAGIPSGSEGAASL